MQSYGTMHKLFLCFTDFHVVFNVLHKHIVGVAFAERILGIRIQLNKKQTFSINELSIVVALQHKYCTLTNQNTVDDQFQMKYCI